MPEWPPAPETVRRDAAALGVELNDQQVLQIIQFGQLLLRWNRAFNLVSRRDAGRLYARHLLDSLSILPWLPAVGRSARVLDLGTGAGLPGIPLAVARPDLAFVLIDRNERKIRLVEQAARTLELDNVRAQCTDVTLIQAGGDFDCVVSRAVAALAEIWRLGAPVLKPGGRLLLMAHGQRDHEDRAATGVPEGACLVDVERLPIPGLEHPHELLVVEREAAEQPDKRATDTEN